MNAGPAASRTAVLVCQGRAVAHGHFAQGRFDDPTALEMLNDAERKPVERARSPEAPNKAGERIEYEMLRANAEVMVPRTIVIDDAVRSRPTSQVVILGAGLDGRAWRMRELSSVDVFEVDQPSSQNDKRQRTRQLDPVVRTLHFVPVDFTHDDLDTSLETAGHVDTTATTWIWEGVVPYLTPAAVRDTAGIIGRRSAPGSRLMVNYQTPSWSAAGARLVARALAMVTRRTDPLANEPRRSAWTPEAMRDLLRQHGFNVVSDDDLLSISASEHLTPRHERSLSLGRVAIADK